LRASRNTWPPHSSSAWSAKPATRGCPICMRTVPDLSSDFNAHGQTDVGDDRAAKSGERFDGSCFF
jgi:hypothetical protein